MCHVAESRGTLWNRRKFTGFPPLFIRYDEPQNMKHWRSQNAISSHVISSLVHRYAVDRVHRYGIGFLTRKKPIHVPYRIQNYMMSIEPRLSSCLSGNYHALSQFDISLNRCISCHFGEFISIVTPPIICQSHQV